MKISIITVCYNALEDLKKTRSSILMQTEVAVEHIIIDGASTDGTREWLATLPQDTIWRSEKDNGIYDAMNKGISLATSPFLLFLNAGDYFVGDLLKGISSPPGLIPVKAIKPFVGETFLKPANYKLGLPYCHQGIIFENKGVTYNTSYRFAADYDYYLRCQYTQLPFISSPSNGYVYYDNFGTSQIHAKKRDAEIAQVIKKEFGKKQALIFCLISRIKLAVKKTLLPILS